MSGHEARINDALRQLGEEFRLGMVQAEEYRSRRRMLLESWGEIDATTSPGSLRSKTATTPNRTKLEPTPSTVTAGKRAAVPFLIVVGLVVLAVGAYFALKPKAPAAGAAGGGAAAEALSPQLQAVGKAADDFVAANAWDAAAIDGFLQTWRALSAADRARADELPGLRALRYKLDQNIQAESQLVAPDAPPEERQRLTQLEAFARELSGGTP